MAEEHLKKCSPCLATRGSQIKTAFGISSYISQNGKINKTNDSICLQGFKENGTLSHCWWEHKRGRPLWKPAWQSLRKLGSHLPQGPATQLLGTYPTDAVSCYTDTCSSMFNTSPYIIVRNSLDAHQLISNENGVHLHNEILFNCSFFFLRNHGILQ